MLVVPLPLLLSLVTNCSVGTYSTWRTKHPGTQERLRAASTRCPLGTLQSLEIRSNRMPSCNTEWKILEKLQEKELENVVFLPPGLHPG